MYLELLDELVQQFNEVPQLTVDPQVWTYARFWPIYAGKSSHSDKRNITNKDFHLANNLNF